MDWGLYRRNALAARWLFGIAALLIWTLFRLPHAWSFDEIAPPAFIAALTFALLRLAIGGGGQSLGRYPSD